MRKFNVAIVGATGAVGRELLWVLAYRNFPIGELRLLASNRSAGTWIGQLQVHQLTEQSFDAIDIAIFSAGSERSKAFAPAAVEAGAVVIDNSSAFRMDPKVPLVVPEINAEVIRMHSGIIANPNCSTIIMNVPVWPLHRRVNRVKRIVVSTYQAVSGAGAWGLHELEKQQRDFAAGRTITKEKFPHQIFNNVFSHDSKVDSATGYNEEELKMLKETHKIFGDTEIAITATCVRLPVPRAHCEAINLEFERPITPQEVRGILAHAPGVKIVDNVDRNHFPMPLEANGKDDVLVGRIRQDISRVDGRGIDLFVSGDQLLKGAALNAVQIAEIVVSNWQADAYA
jgi:aspartate-semialdehyde dehydrogenase